MGLDQDLVLAKNEALPWNTLKHRTSTWFCSNDCTARLPKLQTNQICPRKTAKEICNLELGRPMPWVGFTSFLSFLQIGFGPPPPAPDFLSKDFCLEPGLDQKRLLKRTWSDKTLLPLQFPEHLSLRKENQVILGKNLSFWTRLEKDDQQTSGWGWRNDPDFWQGRTRPSTSRRSWSGRRDHCLKSD